jgi:hypothetical protein
LRDAGRPFGLCYLSDAGKGGTIMRKIMPFALGALLAAPGFFPSSLLAQERYDDATVKELGRFDIDIGFIVLDDYDTTFRIDSTSVPVGAVIDLGDQLDVDTTSTSGRIDGYYRFTKKHRIYWTYYSSKRDGNATLTSDLTLTDPETGEECTISAGATVDSQWKFQLLKVGYNWSFLNTRKYELFLGGGLNIRDLDFSLEAEGATSGSCNLDSGGNERVAQNGTIPLPVFNFGGRWNFTPKWQTRWQFQAFALEFGDYKGSTREVEVLFENRTFKNVGFGGGITTYDVQLEADSSDIRGEITSNYIGLLGYVKVYF